jgi:hypothetical protein
MATALADKEGLSLMHITVIAAVSTKKVENSN